jgi:hypothetical protein
MLTYCCRNASSVLNGSSFSTQLSIGRFDTGAFHDENVRECTACTAYENVLVTAA